MYVFYSLEKGMATHSSILAWRIPWTEEPGRLQSIGLQRVGHDWSDLAAAAAAATLVLALAWEKWKLKVLVTQLHLTLFGPMDCSLPGSSVHGILQVRMLEWVAILFSRGSSWPMDWTRVSCTASRFFTILATREVLTICNAPSHSNMMLFWDHS